MADSTISGLSAAAVADRTMEVPVNKGGGENAKVTLEQIVDLVSDAISNALSVAQVPASVTSAEFASVTSGVGGGSGSVTSDELSAVSSQISLTNSALGSVDAHANAASGAATSVDARVNALSDVVSLISDRLSNEISARTASIQTLSNAVTSVDTRVNTVSDLVSALTSAHNALSNRVSANSGTGGGGSVTSAEVVSAVGVSCRAFSAAGSATTSVKGLQSVIDRISNTFSNAFSAGSVISAAITSINGQTRLITTTIAASVGTTLTGIDGTTVSVSAGGYYEYRAKLNMAMSAANAYKIGITFPAMVVGAAGGIMQGIGSVGASAWMSTIGNVQIMSFDDDGSGSVILSVVKGVVSASPVHIDANFAASASGNIFLMYAASVSTSNVKINPGSHVRLFKIG